MRLRAQTPQGPLQVGQQLTLDSKLDHLRSEIQTLLGFDVKLKHGFPPKPLDRMDSSLKELGFRDGDQLIVERNQQATLQQAFGLDERTESFKMEQGTLCVRVMKDDNSCLFRSISYLMTKDPEQHADYRQLVANVIMSDPDRYNAVFLGRSNQEYCQWILNPKSWGGAIEISIFSEQLQMEIISLDVSTGRMDRFGEGTYKSSAFVMYSGIHYDAIVLTPHLGASKDFDQTVFEDAEVLIPAVSSLGALWKKKHKYTDVANFTLKCGVCGIGLQGQSAAQKHCQQTGHAQFTEYQ